MGTAESPVLALFTEKSIQHNVHAFEYVEGGGTARSSGELGISEHVVVKTLVFVDQDSRPLIVLMHGDCKVNLKALAEQIGVTKVRSCSAEAAEAASGWQVGSTNPFCLKQPLPVFAESSIMQCEKIWINGGGRGLLVEMAPADLPRLIDDLRLVQVAMPR